MTSADVEIIEKQVCYEGFFRIERYHLKHRLYNGSWSGEIVRELFERGHAAAILPYDPLRDEVVLIEQFRVGALNAPGGPWLKEIVAGVIDGDETTEDVVRREAVEEAGCIITDLIPICNYLVSPGGTSEMISLYCGKVDATGVGGIHGLDEENEDIKVTAIPYSDAIDLMNNGMINSASPIMALQWLALNHQRVRAQWSHG